MGLAEKEVLGLIRLLKHMSQYDKHIVDKRFVELVKDRKTMKFSQFESKINEIVKQGAISEGAFNSALQSLNTRSSTEKAFGRGNKVRFAESILKAVKTNMGENRPSLKPLTASVLKDPQIVSRFARTVVKTAPLGASASITTLNPAPLLAAVAAPGVHALGTGAYNNIKIRRAIKRYKRPVSMRGRHK